MRLEVAFQSLQKLMVAKSTTTLASIRVASNQRWARPTTSNHKIEETILQQEFQIHPSKLQTEA